jgi:hypothetical protein
MLPRVQGTSVRAAPGVIPHRWRHSVVPGGSGPRLTRQRSRACCLPGRSLRHDRNVARRGLNLRCSGHVAAAGERSPHCGDHEKVPTRHRTLPKMIIHIHYAGPPRGLSTQPVVPARDATSVAVKAE